MTLAELFPRLKSHGVTVSLAGDRLELNGPATGRAAVRELVRSHKVELLAALPATCAGCLQGMTPGPLTAAGCGWAGCQHQPPPLVIPPDELARVCALSDSDFGPVRPPHGPDPVHNPALPTDWVCSRDPKTGLPTTGVVPPGQPVPEDADCWTQRGAGRWVRIDRHKEAKS